MAKRSRSRKKRSGRGRRGGGGGVLMGMRSGFKSAAGTVTGNDRGRKRSWLGLVVTLILVLAAVALVLGRV